MTNWVQLVKWGLKSTVGLTLNLALLTVWVEVVGLGEAVAVLPNFVIVGVAMYVVVDRWVFPDGVSPTTLRGHATQYLGMQAANGTSKVANYALYLLLIPVVDYRLAWVVGAVVTFLLTFSLNRRWWMRRSGVGC